MRLSAAGLALLKRSEGFRSRTYLDSAGIATIGYGHRLEEHESFPDEIDEAHAARMLADDISHAERAVERLVEVALSQGQFDALTDFCFNLGAGRLASSTLLKALNQGHYESAREQLLRWDRAAGEANIGLRERREAEFGLWAESVEKRESVA